MRKIYLMLSFFVLAFGLCSCRMPNTNEAFEQIRIGVILPLSGNEKVQGKAALDGMEIAVETVNKEGGINGRKIQLCIYNSTGNPDKAAELAQETIDNDNVVALIGAYSSNEALEIKYVAEKNGVPYVANMATHESLNKTGDYSFQSTLNDEIQSAALAYYIAFKRNFSNPAILLSTDVSSIYPKGIGRKTAQAWAYFTGRRPMMITYNSNQKSFENIIKKCIYEDVDVIVLPAYPECALRFITEARKLKYRGAFAGSDSYDHPFLINTGEDLGDCFFTTPYYHGNKSESNLEFKKLMLSRYNRIPGCAEAMGYDGMLFLMKGLKDAYTPDEIAGKLRAMRTFESVSGEIGYHQKQEIMLHPVFIMSVSGKYKPAVYSWKVNSEQLKKYRNRDEE